MDIPIIDPESNRNEKWKSLWFELCLLFLSLLTVFTLTASLADLTPNFKKGLDNGWFIYLDISTYLKGIHTISYPFAQRLLSPLLAAGITSLGIPIQFSWVIITVAAQTLAVYFVSCSVKAVGGNSGYLRTLSIFLAAFTFWYTGFNLRWFFLVDPFNNFIFSLCLFFFLTRRYFQYYLIILLGIFNKETPLILLPLPLVYYFVASNQKRSIYKDATFQLLFLMTACVTLLYKLWRVFLEYVLFIKVQPFGSNGPLSSVENAIVNTQYLKEVRVSFECFDFFWIAALLGIFWIKDKGYIKQHLHILVAACYLFVVMTMVRFFTDVPRAYAYLTPCIITLSIIPFVSKKINDLIKGALAISALCYLFLQVGRPEYAMRPGALPLEIKPFLSIIALASWIIGICASEKACLENQRS